MPVRLLGPAVGSPSRPRHARRQGAAAPTLLGTGPPWTDGLLSVSSGTALGGLNVCLFYLEQAEVELWASQAVDGAALFAQLDEVVHAEALQVREALG